MGQAAGTDAFAALSGGGNPFYTDACSRGWALAASRQCSGMLHTQHR